MLKSLTETIKTQLGMMGRNFGHPMGLELLPLEYWTLDKIKTSVDFKIQIYYGYFAYQIRVLFSAQKA
jgi:hypothetical protein